jgi:hypothetical protein
MSEVNRVYMNGMEVDVDGHGVRKWAWSHQENARTTTERAPHNVIQQAKILIVPRTHLGRVVISQAHRWQSPRSELQDVID